MAKLGCHPPKLVDFDPFPACTQAYQTGRPLSDYRYGKSMIRSEIEVIIGLGPKFDVQYRAQQVCRDIGVLNGELERLDRMVYDK